MTLDSFSSIGSNLVGMTVGAATLYGLIVRPMREKLKEAAAALALANQHLQAFTNARLIERLDEMEDRLGVIESASFERKEARQVEHQTIKEFVREQIGKSDDESRVARKRIHEDIAAVRNELIRVDTQLGDIREARVELFRQMRELTIAVSDATARLEARP